MNIKPKLLSELKKSLDTALFLFRVFRDKDAIHSLSKGERLISILAKYDKLYPGRYADHSEAIKSWLELDNFLNKEKKNLRDEIVKLNIQNDFKKFIRKKDIQTGR